MHRRRIQSARLTLTVAASLFVLSGCFNEDFIPIPVPNPTCLEGETRLADDGCNTCSCEEDGTWACTLMYCEETECVTDADCFQTGCSGEICAAVDVASTCEWTSDLACYTEPTTSCGCFEGVCGWDPTDELDACLENPPCEEGETRLADDGCNECYCDAGGFWSCTEMACPEPECSPGDVMGECDECFCADEGFWVCADVICPEPECSPGEVSGECDECFCTDEGYWDCVDIACPEPECSPGDVMGDCDECFCTDEGFWACDDVVCPEMCALGDRRPAGDGCNDCWCDDSGNWICTEMVCPPPMCEPGDVMGDCGECFCTDEGFWVCADVECPECEPGEIGGECGECICADSGHWLCEGGCEPSCEPGESVVAPDGCNTCVCGDDGAWSCTEMACGSECASDDDCFATGCSGQLCASVDIATTCEWLPEYACFAEPTTSCGCFDGICEWERTDAFEECLGFE